MYPRSGSVATESSLESMGEKSQPTLTSSSNQPVILDGICVLGLSASDELFYRTYPKEAQRKMVRKVCRLQVMFQTDVG
jgi:hypothetical protein